jgi:hypothetical protein
MYFICKSINAINCEICSGSMLVSLILLIPAVLAVVYLLIWQTYVLRYQIETTTIYIVVQDNLQLKLLTIAA